MPIPVASLADLTEDDLLALVSEAVREDKTLEYKRDTYGAGDDARTEFLADVSALANTSGGDLVIGIEEAAGIAGSLVGVAVDADKEILRLQQMATAGIQPRLPALEIHAVLLSSGSHVIVVRVGRSYNPPHRVVFKNRNRFYVRGPAGRYEPDMDGLRSLFNVASSLAERIREFRTERLGTILAGETPVRLRTEPGMVLIHVVPFSSVDGSAAGLDLGGIDAGAERLGFLGASSLEDRVNLDGIVVFRRVTEAGSGAYCQVFRSGAVEVVVSGLVRHIAEGAIVSADQVANHLRHHVRNTTLFLRRQGIDSPCAVFLSLVGARGARLTTDDATWRDFDEALPIPRDVVSFVEAIVPERAIMADLPRALRPLLDQLGQGMGLPRAMDRWLT